jgi:hypothetical protein
MTVSSAARGRSRTLILAAMIFAVAMTFIDDLRRRDDLHR